MSYISELKTSNRPTSKRDFLKHVAFLFRLPYKMYFGGVSALTPTHYLKMNGFPNNYWGWGGEDDDIGVR